MIMSPHCATSYKLLGVLFTVVKKNTLVTHIERYIKQQTVFLKRV